MIKRKWLAITLWVLLMSAYSSAQITGGVTVVGSITPGDCASFVSVSSIQDAGAPCGSGGGGGTVTSVSGTANQIAVTNGTTTPVISITNPLITPGIVTIPGGTLTTDVQTLLTTQTYNNAAQLFRGLLNVTVDSAHGAGSMLRQDLCGVAGTTVCWSLDPSGNSIDLGTSTATAQKAVGTGAGLQEVTQGASNIGILDVNSAAFMAPTSIPTAYAILMPTAAPTAASVFTIGAVSAQVSQGGFTPTPNLGTDGSVAGSLQVANGSSAAHTIWGSGATTSNEIDGPTVVPVNGDLLRCTVAGASTTCVLTDAGILAANVVLASSPGAGIAHFAGSTQTVTSSAIVNADITSMAESKLTGAAAAATITEVGAGDVITRVGVETGNLTAPYVFTDGNSSNNNTNIGLIAGVTGTSTGGIGALVFDVSGTGDIQRWYTGGSVSLGVYTIGTLKANLTAAGGLVLAGALTVNGECGSGTAGCLVLPQGSAQGHATANAIVVEAPAAVTAYEEILPGTSATGFAYGTNSSAVRTDSFGELSGDVTTSGSLATTVVKVNGVTQFAPAMTTSAMGGQTSASCTNVTNMTWNIAANKNYILKCEIPMTLAASATIQYCLGGPGTATSYSLAADGDLGTAGVWSQISTLAQTAYGTKTGASASVAATSVQHVWAGIQNGATASGTALTLQTAANGTNAITVLANATCQLTQIN